ncbi:PAS domain-containing protein [Flavobacterium restrictum]|uniref:PAS domain-containing protein n=1 Tax=Flavobacterium restrictum TaxID=2594428 RepID=A0A553E5Z9_9FLAO|nr:PAS domain-containing protein [Flavobacterium restrictum]TRX40478.1 PAS domain-containing protein [Flavobacterium restrictum]
MLHLREYDKANAKNFSTLNLKSTPVRTWNFHKEFLLDLKHLHQDYLRITTLAQQNKWAPTNWDLQSDYIETVVIVTDSNLKIVYASSNMAKMNGYNESDILGKSPKMFHGKDTCQKTSGEIRQAIAKQEPFEKTVLNYKKNGKEYQCLIKSFPVFNIKGQLSHFIAFEKTA